MTMLDGRILQRMIAGAMVLGGAACASDRGAHVDLVDRAKDPGEWVQQASDYSLTRYSPLAQLTAANVGQLQPMWTYSTGRK